MGLPVGRIECMTMLACEFIFLTEEEKHLFFSANKIFHKILYSCAYFFWKKNRTSAIIEIVEKITDTISFL